MTIIYGVGIPSLPRRELSLSSVRCLGLLAIARICFTNITLIRSKACFVRPDARKEYMVVGTTIVLQSLNRLSNESALCDMSVGLILAKAACPACLRRCAF